MREGCLYAFADQLLRTHCLLLETVAAGKVMSVERSNAGFRIQ